MKDDKKQRELAADLLAVMRKMDAFFEDVEDRCRQIAEEANQIENSSGYEPDDETSEIYEEVTNWFAAVQERLDEAFDQVHGTKD